MQPKIDSNFEWKDLKLTTRRRSNLMKFGENLYNLRKNAKMSQEKLAEKISVSRQSISKWENGESYPEMDKILKLCNIFHCKINDLVHEDLTDINSLDEEIIMSVVKFNEKKQNQVKSLSNVISLIGKIGGIVLKVAIPFIILAMILIPFIISNVEVKENQISFKTDNIKIIDENKIEIHDIIVGELDIDDEDYDVIEMFENNSNIKIITYVETGLVFLLVELYIMIIILGCVEKLFNNIKENTTPFTLDNVNYIKKISYLIIALILISPISDLLFSILLGISNGGSSPFELMNILEILIIFSMSYIFEYGYEIQQDSKGKMYGNKNENKEEYIKVLMGKTNRSEEECIVLNQIIEKHFIVGKNNKEKIINDIIQKLQLEYKEADELYNICIENILKGIFKK